MTASLSVNGFDLWTTFGFYLIEPQGVFDAVDRTWNQIPVHGRAGVVFGAPAREGGRKLQFRGGIKTTAGTTAARVAAEDQLKDLLRAGLLRIVRNDGVTTARMIEGYAGRINITPIGNTLTSSDSRVQFYVDCQDAYWQNQQPTVRNLISTGTRYTLPVGTAPSSPIIRVMGSANTPVLTYRDAGGVAVFTTTIGINLGASDYVDLDMRVGKVTKYVSGTPSDAIGTITGDFPWAIDPQDGNYTLANSPTLETSLGTAAAYWWNRWQ